MLTTALLVLHILLVQRQGMSVPISLKNEPPRPPMPFFPNFFLRELMGWAIALAVLAALASLFPWELGTKADPFAPAPAGIKPEWYFLFMFQTLKMLPASIAGVEGELLGLILFTFGGLLWFLLPVLDRRSMREERSPVVTAIGVLVLAFIGLMTLLGYVTP
jgi:quinol-cytochrome oxidoreductase complex cytochrome b subunit